MDERKRIEGRKFVEQYHSILCSDVPDFIYEYASLPIVHRLAGVGLLCGTDWTPLFDNRFFYSRLDHSVGVALIIWRFTHDKRQTLAGLFHDIATPAFSHVIDFKNGDTENQESTEESTQQIINDDLDLSELLFKEGIYKYEIDNYSKYPLANNDRPGLNADRLEYMYPSGAALNDVWTIDKIRDSYSFTTVLKNEKGLDEIGFTDLNAAADYVHKFLDISIVLQKNEDKVSMQLLADTLSKAMECGFLSDSDMYELDEESLVRCFDRIVNENKELGKTATVDGNPGAEFCRYWRTFRGMKSIIRNENPQENSYNLSLNVKRRYVDPLVKNGSNATRVSKLNKEAAQHLDDFLNFNDSTYGSVPWL